MAVVREFVCGKESVVLGDFPNYHVNRNAEDSTTISWKCKTLRDAEKKFFTIAAAMAGRAFKDHRTSLDMLEAQL